MKYLSALDRICVFLTNHTEKQGRGFKMKPQTIIKAYRDKTKKDFLNSHELYAPFKDIDIASFSFLSPEPGF